jgi:hypothetical protein
MATVLVRDINGNTLAKVEVEGSPAESWTSASAGTVRAYDNNEGWVVTLYREEDQ